MDITAFIRELLFGHDCVIIPGFGGFIGNYVSARIDRNSGTFYPPVKQISFNRNISHNDGLLVGRISASMKLNYRDARNLVEEFVNDLKRKIDRGEKVVFDNIGTFINNEEGNVLFEPDTNVNYHLDSYGFESFQYLPAGGFDVRKRIVKYPPKESIRRISVKKLLWRAAIVIPLLAIMVAIPVKIDLFKARIETTTLNPLVTAELEHNKSAIDDAKAEANVKEDSFPLIKESVEIKAVEPVDSKIILPAEPAGPQAGYFIITGSFKSEENALVQIRKLRTDGFAPEVVAASNGFYRVSAMLCGDIGTALLKIDSIAKKYPGSWVSRKK